MEKVDHLTFATSSAERWLEHQFVHNIEVQQIHAETAPPAFASKKMPMFSVSAGRQRTFERTFDVPLDGRSLRVRLDRPDSDTEVWSGVIEGQPGSFALVAVAPTIQGILWLPDGRTLFLEPDGQGAGTVIEVHGNGLHEIDSADDTTLIDETLDLNQIFYVSTATSPGRPKYLSDRRFYRDELAPRSSVRGEQLLIQLITTTGSRLHQDPARFTEALVNRAFKDSAIPHAVHVIANPVDYDASGKSIDHVLFELVTGSGKLDVAHRLRRQHRADIVVLIVPERRLTNTSPDHIVCGKTPTILHPDEQDTDYRRAFAVVADSCIWPRLTILHEIGHILGAEHEHTVSRARPSGLPYFMNSYAQCTSSESDVMASCHDRRSPWFSRDIEADNAATLTHTIRFASRWGERL